MSQMSFRRLYFLLFLFVSRHLHFMKGIAIAYFLAFLAFAVTSCTAEQGTIECDLCHFIVKEIDNLLEQQKTVDFIEKEVNKTCNLEIFKAHAIVCETILDYGIEELIKFIEEYETPDEACGPDQLNLCPSMKEMIAILQKKLKIAKIN